MAKIVKGQARFYKMSQKGKKTSISRSEYKHLSQSNHTEHLYLLTREECTVFEDDDNDEEASGPAIMRVDAAEIVLSQTRTQTHCDETITVADTPVVTLGVTNTVLSQAHAETPRKQMYMLPDIKNVSASQKDQ